MQSAPGRAFTRRKGKEQLMRLLGWDGLKERGITHSRSQIWRKVRDGSFPPPLHIGRRPAWLEEEIDAYIGALIAKRDSITPSKGPLQAAV